MKYLPHSSMYMEWFRDEEQYSEKYQKKRKRHCPLETDWAEERCDTCKQEDLRKSKMA